METRSCFHLTYLVSDGPCVDVLQNFGEERGTGSEPAWFLDTCWMFLLWRIHGSSVTIINCQGINQPAQADNFRFLVWLSKLTHFYQIEPVIITCFIRYSTGSSTRLCAKSCRGWNDKSGTAPLLMIIWQRVDSPWRWMVWELCQSPWMQSQPLNHHPSRMFQAPTSAAKQCCHGIRKISDCSITEKIWSLPG